mgnify:CR=1 FL=1
MISIFIITGCNTSTFEYNGDEIFYEVNGTETDTINAKKGKKVQSKSSSRDNAISITMSEETRQNAIEMAKARESVGEIGFF